jgi:hypothetical protein
MDDTPAPDREEILARWTDGTLIDALFDNYGRMWLEEDSPTIELLAGLHNAGEIDLLAILTTESVERHKGYSSLTGNASMNTSFLKFLALSGTWCALLRR